MTLTVSGIAPVTVVHVHAGVTGPVVAAFTEAGTGTSIECLAFSDELIKKIRRDPDRYYLDVHTTEFPNGALRGQFTKPNG